MLNVYEELADCSRRMILSELRSGPKSVMDLVLATNLKQPNVSNHLARMRCREIVKPTKIGRQVFYSFATPEIEAAVASAFMPNAVPRKHCPICELTEEYARAAVQGDEQACSDVLDIVFRLRLPLLTIYQDLLAPAMQAIGTLYMSGEINVAQEHIASAITERMMARTVQMACSCRKSSHVALLGCTPNNWHTIGLRMVADYMQTSGWKALFLGANVPIGCFLSSVRKIKPKLVLLSCCPEASAKDGFELIESLRQLKSEGLCFSIGVGGHYVRENPSAFMDAGADFTCLDLRTFATQILPGLESS